MKLFKEFPPIATQEWEQKLIADLKGKDYQKTLVWKNDEGIDVKPYYRAENIEGFSVQDEQPGVFPYTRGNQEKGNNWYIRHDIEVTDFAAANKRVLDLVSKRGVNSIGFHIKTEWQPEDLKQLLKGIPDEVELNFQLACTFGSLFSALTQYAQSEGRSLKKMHVSEEKDPFQCSLRVGRVTKTREEHIQRLKLRFEEQIETFQDTRVLSVKANVYNSCGASIVQELALGLAHGVEYLDILTDGGVSAETFAKGIKFHFSVGTNFFMEIAKLRAARRLWAGILTSCGCPEEAAKMNIHCTTSTWNKTLYDPHVNMLRTQTEAMAAAIGGTGSLTVAPFNSHFSEPSALSERIAVNQQLLLKEESSFDKVADPSAGSYYVEMLTEAIAQKAWEFFLQIQEEGGFLSALKKEFIQKQINQVKEKRDRDIAFRKQSLLGTNQFPNLDEKLSFELSEELLIPANEQKEDAEFESLKPYRGAMAFEALRYRTEKSRKEPKVFMLTFGHSTMRSARSQFATNFFAIAGFKTIDNNGFATPEEGAEAALQAGANITVLCSSDEEYLPAVKSIAATLHSKTIVAIAGYPKADMEAIQQEGVKHFIHVKSNVLEELKNFQKILGC